MSTPIFEQNIQVNLPKETCTQCEFTGTKNQVKRHIRRVHQDVVSTVLRDGRTVEARRNNGVFECPFTCGSAFEDPCGWCQHLDGHCKMVAPAPKRQFKATAHRTPKMQRVVSEVQHHSKSLGIQQQPEVGTAGQKATKPPIENTTMNGGVQATFNTHQTCPPFGNTEFSSPSHVLTQYFHRVDAPDENAIENYGLFPEGHDGIKSRSLTPLACDDQSTKEPFQMVFNDPASLHGFDGFQQNHQALSESLQKQLEPHAKYNRLPQHKNQLSITTNSFNRREDDNPRAWLKRKFDNQINVPEIDQVYKEFVHENVYKSQVSVNSMPDSTKIVKASFVHDVPPNRSKALVVYSDSEEEIQEMDKVKLLVTQGQPLNRSSNDRHLDAQVYQVRQVTSTPLPTNHSIDPIIGLSESPSRLVSASQPESYQQVPNDNRCDKIPFMIGVQYQLLIFFSLQRISFLYAQNQPHISNLNVCIAYLSAFLLTVFV